MKINYEYLISEAALIGTCYIIPTIKKIIKSGCEYIEQRFLSYFECHKNIDEPIVDIMNLSPFQVIIDGEVKERIFITMEELEAYNKAMC